ncbi:hypothetical protein HanIR_Chr12g0591221 [Helianthus annuus]|nr:hypothetical protein HanIR_Chr12g0591221 [Helianthus annuus]
MEIFACAGIDETSMQLSGPTSSLFSRRLLLRRETTRDTGRLIIRRKTRGQFGIRTSFSN